MKAVLLSLMMISCLYSCDDLEDIEVGKDGFLIYSDHDDVFDIDVDKENGFIKFPGMIPILQKKKQEELDDQEGSNRQDDPIDQEC